MNRGTGKRPEVVKQTVVCQPTFAAWFCSLFIPVFVWSGRILMAFTAPPGAPATHWPAIRTEGCPSTCGDVATGLFFDLGMLGLIPLAFLFYGYWTLLSVRVRATPAGLHYRQGWVDRFYPWSAIRKFFWREEVESARYFSYTDDKMVVVFPDGQVRLSRIWLTRLDALDDILVEHLGPPALA